MKVSSLYIAQVKDECRLGKRENYNKSKKKDAKVPLCPENKKEVIKAALEHFEMISDWKKSKQEVKRQAVIYEKQEAEKKLKKRGREVSSQLEEICNQSNGKAGENEYQ